MKMSYMYIMWVDHCICHLMQNLMRYIILLIFHLLNTVKCQTFNLQFQQPQ